MSQKKDNENICVEKTIKVRLPAKKEHKCKGVHLLLTPSVYEKLRKLAKESGRSNNEFISYLIEQL